MALTAHSYPHLVLARAEMNLGGFAHRGRCRRAHACSGRRKWQQIGAAGSTAPRNGTSSAVPPIRIGHLPKNWFYTSLINFIVQQLLHSTKKTPSVMLEGAFRCQNPFANQNSFANTKPIFCMLKLILAGVFARRKAPRGPCPFRQAQMAADGSNRKHGAPRWDFKRNAPHWSWLFTRKVVLHTINSFAYTKLIFCMSKLILAGFSHGGRCWNEFGWVYFKNDTNLVCDILNVINCHSGVVVKGLPIPQGVVGSTPPCVCGWNDSFCVI